MKRRLLDQLAGSHDFEVPPSMVEAEYNNIMAQLRHEASHDQNPDASLKEIESEADDYRKIAERRVRLGLLLSEIGAANGVEVSQTEMNRLIGQAAAQYPPQDRDRFIQYVQTNRWRPPNCARPYNEDKVVDLLFAKEEVTERTATAKSLKRILESGHGMFHVRIAFMISETGQGQEGWRKGTCAKTAKADAKPRSCSEARQGRNPPARGG